MPAPGPQLPYWNAAGATKTFTHPVDAGHLSEVSRDARVLDYGCGYGRVMSELSGLGFRDVSGVDVSAALIARGRRERPGLSFALLDEPPAVPGAAPASFDLVLLFAVLTCVPDDDAQRGLVAELSRILAPGGLLYVSDVVLQDDARNRARYAAHARGTGAPYGVFGTDDGAVCRHHEPAHLRSLLAGFDLVDERGIDVVTMNGHRARGVQMVARAR